MLRGIGVFSNQSSLQFMMLGFYAHRFDICVSFWVSEVGDSVLLWKGREEEREAQRG